MSTLDAEIDALVAKLRNQPRERQEAAVEMLREITEDVYELSAEELAVLLPALADAEAGRKLLSLDEVDRRTRSMIDEWRK